MNLYSSHRKIDLSNKVIKYIISNVIHTIIPVHICVGQIYHGDTVYFNSVYISTSMLYIDLIDTE